jgi:hypothetical protein
MSATVAALASSPAFEYLHTQSLQSSNRGSSVDLLNDQIAISVTADWLEGELWIGIRIVGGTPLDFDKLADSSSVKGLSLTRLKGGVSVDSLARRLRQVLELLERAIPGILAGTDSAVGALRTMGA